MNTDRNKLQRTTLEKIKKLNDLQKDELVDIVMAYTEKAIDVINERGGEVEHDITETLAELLKESSFGGFRRMITQEEIRVTKNTLNGLLNKGILTDDEPYKLEGTVYYRWTGKELK